MTSNETVTCSIDMRVNLVELGQSIEKEAPSHSIGKGVVGWMRERVALPTGPPRGSGD